MDPNGLLNPQGLWNRTGALLAILFFAAVFIPQHLFFLEGLLAAMIFFTAAWLPLLFAAFLLALVAVAVQYLAAQAARGRAAMASVSRRASAPRRWRELAVWLREPVRPAFPHIPVFARVRVATLLELPRRAHQPKPPETHRAA